MPQLALRSRPSRKRTASKPKLTDSRFTVALAPDVAGRVEKFAGTVDASMSKAIAALVRIGLDSQEERKREFFRKLKQNLSNDDPKQEDQLVDEFRSLILGR